jgi:hypothetical protein
MSNHDRKDLPHSHDALDARVPAAETHTDRMERKQKESDALDQALEETFPTSDPISPFVPAIASEPVDSENQVGRSQKCAHDACTCEVKAPDAWCSDECREAQQGYTHEHASDCGCGHAECGAASAKQLAV